MRLMVDNPLFRWEVVRIIFERGLEVSDRPQSVELRNREGNYEEIIEEMHARFVVRPCIVVNGMCDYLEPETVLLSHLSPRPPGLVFPGSPPRVFFEQSATQNDHVFIQSMDYLIRAMIYHCRELSLTYVDHCNFAWAHEKRYGSLSGSEDFVIGRLGSDSYFELDALITAARRAYDGSRFILWNWFRGKMKDCPDNFPNTVKRLGNSLPLDLRERLNTSWKQYGTKLADYRDCLIHFSPLDDNTAVRLRRHDGDIYSCQIVIPDNPEARSKKKFKYETGTDAFEYGWSLVNEICSLFADILQSCP